MPLWEFGLPDDAALEVEDLMRGHRFTWHGKMPAHRARSRASYPSSSGVSSAGRSVMDGLTAAHARSTADDDPLWYKDAIIYQLHVKAFFDANDDGIGDFAG